MTGKPSGPPRRPGAISARSPIDAREGEWLAVGSTLTPAEVEFGCAVERYKREHHRPFPTCSEVLGVLLALGYRKGDV